VARADGTSVAIAAVAAISDAAAPSETGSSGAIPKT
jgi:hypothetical protein